MEDKKKEALKRQEEILSNSTWIRVQRGMVFSYNLDESVSKRSNPTVTVGSRTVRDHKQYGLRDFVVVSNDVNNLNSPTCQICPISAQEDNRPVPYHVEFIHERDHLTVLCEHIYTVNTDELYRYRYVLCDKVMSQVTETLANQLSIPIKDSPSDVEASLEHIENIISKIVEARVQAAVEQYKAATAEKLDVSDAVLRIGEGLETLFHDMIPTSVSKAPEPVKEAVEEVKPDPEPTINPPNVIKVPASVAVPKPEKPAKSKPSVIQEKCLGAREDGRPRQRRRWDMPTIQEFLKDEKELPLADCMAKWGLDSPAALYRTKNYVSSRVGFVR